MSSFFIILAGICWGLLGLATRPLTALGFTSIQECALRCVLAAVFLTSFLAIRSPSLLKIKLRDLWMFFGTGVVSLIMFNVCYFTTIEKTALSTAAILLYTSPVFVMLMSALFFRERITARKITALILALFGCVLVTGILNGMSGNSAGIAPTDILIGIGSGFFYALYSIFGRVALAKYHTLTVTAYTFIVSGICILPFCGAPEIIQCITVHPISIFYILFLVLVATVAPYVLYTAGLRNMEAGKAAVMASVEPVVASIAGILIYHEPMTLEGAAGAILVLASVVILNLPIKQHMSKFQQKKNGR